MKRHRSAFAVAPVKDVAMLAATASPHPVHVRPISAPLENELGGLLAANWLKDASARERTSVGWLELHLNLPRIG